MSDDNQCVFSPDALYEPLGKRVYFIGVVLIVISVLCIFSFNTVMKDFIATCGVAAFIAVTIAFWSVVLIVHHKRYLLNQSTTYTFKNDTLAIRCGNYHKEILLTPSISYEIIHFNGNYDILFNATPIQKKMHLKCFHYLEGTLFLLHGNKEFSFWFYPFAPCIWGISDYTNLLRFLENR